RARVLRHTSGRARARLSRSAAAVMPASGFVAVLVIDLHFPEAGSLKSKRKELSSIKSQLHGRLGLAVAETAHQDLWQRAQLTAAMTGGSLTALSEAADNVER